MRVYKGSNFTFNIFGVEIFLQINFMSLFKNQNISRNTFTSSLNELIHSAQINKKFK